MLRRFSPHRLTELREAAGKSRDDLADATGRTWWAVQTWEIGRAVPTVDSLTLIAELLDCSIDELFEDAQAA